MEFPVEYNNSPEPHPTTPCTLCRNPCSDPEDGLRPEEDKPNRQSTVIFLVRRLLKIPPPQCEELLRVYGDPEEWINLCSPCTSILNQAMDINEQIKLLSKKIDELGEQLALPLKIKPEENDEEWEKVTTPAAREIRRIVFYEDLLVMPEDGMDMRHTEIFPNVFVETEMKEEDEEEEHSINPRYDDDDDAGNNGMEVDQLPETKDQEEEDQSDSSDYHPVMIEKDFERRSSSSIKLKPGKKLVILSDSSDSEEENDDNDDNQNQNSPSAPRNNSNCSENENENDEVKDKECNEEKPEKVVKVRQHHPINARRLRQLRPGASEGILKCIVVGSFNVVFREPEGPNVLTCTHPECCFKTASEKSMKYHVRLAHSKERGSESTLYTSTPSKITDKILPCFPSETVSSSSTPPEDNMIDVTSYKCKECGKSSMERTHMSVHMKQAHRRNHPGGNPEDNKEEFAKLMEAGVEKALVVKTICPPPDQGLLHVMCPFCNFSCNGGKKFLGHVHNVHNFPCYVLAREVDSMKTLSASMGRQNKREGKNKSYPSDLEAVSRRLKVNIFICEENGCGATFETYKAWKLHKNREHFIGFPCEICGKVIRNVMQLEKHVRAKHYDHDQTLRVCPGCKEPSLDSNEYQRHLKHVDCKPECKEKSLPCPHCKWRLENKDTLDIHVKVRHLTEYPAPFVCPHCGKGYKVRNNLYLNHVRSHTEDISVICELCGKRVENRDLLRNHINITHGRTRDFKCSHCPKAFKTNNDLKRHEALHKDVFPFLCNLCGKRFRLKSNLTKHVRSHDPDRTYSPYKPRPTGYTKSKEEGGEKTTRFRPKPPPEEGKQKGDLLFSLPPEDNNSSTQIQHPVFSVPGVSCNFFSN